MKIIIFTSSLSLIFINRLSQILTSLLPWTKYSYCCAPMPFVVGILRSSLQEVIDQPLDTVLVVDLDAGSATVRLGYITVLNFFLNCDYRPCGVPRSHNS